MITSGSFWVVLFGSVAVFWMLPKGREWFLAAVSLVYLAYLDLTSAVLVLVGSAIVHRAGRPLPGQKRASRPLAFASIAGVLLCLGYFKYFPTILYGLSGGRLGQPVTEVVVPLGLSYFTFKLIAYAFDSVRGVVPPHTPQRFLAWTTFFPIFTAGPIERFEPFCRNGGKDFDRRAFGRGLTRIIYGLAKKLVIVDIVFAHTKGKGYDFLWWTPPSLDQILGNLDKTSTLSVWQFVLNRHLSAYLDFSAYSDIAIGGALLFGYEIGENFNYPILATNISDFWKRWHMSLSAWCQRYVYMPIVGKTRSPYIAVFATMFVMGVWHSASLNMIAWGLYHATVIRIYLTWNRIKRRQAWTFDGTAARVCGWALTTAAVCGSTSFPCTTSRGVVAGFRVLFKLIGVTWH